MAESNKITITVKTPKEKKSIVAAEDADIKDVSVKHKGGASTAVFPP